MHAAVRDETVPPGGGYLALIADERKRAIMQSLARASLPGVVLAQALGISERRVRVHVRALSQYGIARRVRSVSASHRVAWTLTEAGRDLLALHDLIASRERRLGLAGVGGADSRPLLQTVCYAHVRALVWALADGPLRLAELERELEWIPRSTLGHGLEQMRESDIVHARGQGADRRYELTSRARGTLALVALSGMRWQLRFAPSQRPWIGGDLLGLLVLLAPIARVPAGVHGTCLMHVALSAPVLRAETMRWPDVHVSVLRGRIAPRAAGALQAPHPFDVRLAANDLDWCEALLGDESARIAIEGDHGLARAVLDALAGALRA